MRIGALFVFATAITAQLVAAPLGTSWAADAFPATASPAAERSAIQSIPFDKLDAAGRAKVNAVLANVTVFRRFPIRVVGCDPDLYFFVVRHPDVLVNIWEVLGISQLQLRATGPDRYRIIETDGMAASIQYLYHTHDTHIAYGDWSYTGSLLGRKINGRCLAILKSGSIREPDGRYYITTRLDGFLSVEPGAVELVTKTLHPLVVKNTDSNFVQTVGFVGSLSRTAEVNNRGMQRLIGKLTHVEPEVRHELAEVTQSIAERAAANAREQSTSMARRTSAEEP